MELAGKRILLGITGGIAAYKGAELLRLLTREGAIGAGGDERSRHTLSSRRSPFRRFPGSRYSATSGIHGWRTTWRTSTCRVPPMRARRPGLGRLHRQGGERPRRRPADDPGARPRLPLLLAPAMNRQMWENPATMRNVATLRADGVPSSVRAAATRPAARADSGGCSKRRRSLTNWSPTSSPGCCRKSRPADRRSDLRGDRPGTRHHQPVERQDGLRHAARRARRVRG
jgi:hypothetical protein